MLVRAAEFELGANHKHSEQSEPAKETKQPTIPGCFPRKHKNQPKCSPSLGLVGLASRRLTALLLALVAFALFLNVPIPTFAIALSPNQSCTVTVSTSGDITVVAGSSGSNTITITLSQGSCGGPLDLAGCTGPLPSGASCGFVPSSGNPTFSTILTISTSPSTPPGTYSLDISLGVTCNCGLSQLPGANDPFNLIVQPAAVTTTTSVNCSPSSINVGSSSSCTATVSGASGSINGETISWTQSGGTGSVTFPSGNTCTLSGTSCSVTVTGDPGVVTLKASYPGDSNNAASSGTFNLTVNSAPPIPEYPFGLAVLVVLMFLAYAVIKRRTGNPKNI